MLLKRLLIFITSILLFQCNHSTNTTNEKNDFGIYLLKDILLTTSDVKIKKLKSLEIQSEPIIN